ncbi:MAG: hypothetical protein ABI120_22175 [Gemmatimonadaceae bacterium]
MSQEVRAERREAAVVAILARAPESDRAAILQLLNANRGNAGFSASRDPEVARQLSVIASIDAVDHPDGASSPPDRQKQKDYLTEGVRVLVALVPNLDVNGARATIIRRPNDGGKPLLLLDYDSATDADVLAGLQAASNSRRMHPNSPSKEIRFDLRGDGITKVAAPRAAGPYVAHLRAGAIRSIDGIGSVRVTEMFAGPDQKQAEK